MKKKLQTLDDLFKIIELEKAKLKFNDGEECFYRGHVSSGWNLTPSLFRIKYDNKYDRFWTESGLFYEFSNRAKQLHHQNLDDWDILFYMRHHAVPTRLIDWTETIGVALYFAILDHDRKTMPCLWLLNPYALNQISWAGRDLVMPKYLLESDDTEGWNYSDFMAADWEDFQWKYPVAIYPPQKNDRVHAQRGWFTIHGTDTRPLDRIKPLKKCMTKIEIPIDLIDPIKEFLERAGINDHTMFPDLDGLSKYLRIKYSFL